MIFTIYKKDTGRITTAGWSAMDIIPSADENILIGKEYFSGWIENDEYHPIPPQTSENYTFNWNTKQWEDLRTSESQWVIIKDQRTKLLQASDWTQLPDVQLPNKEAWAVYRQALRDITNQTDPFNITWPTAPGA